jgi:hypothetical protein
MVVRVIAGAVTGLVFGAVAYLLLRRRFSQARWLPVLGVVGLSAGTAGGLIVGWSVTLVNRSALFLSHPDLFILRQTLIEDLVGSAGLVLAFGYVLRRQLPHFRWWGNRLGVRLRER